RTNADVTLEQLSIPLSMPVAIADKATSDAAQDVEASKDLSNPNDAAQDVEASKGMTNPNDAALTESFGSSSESKAS
ncbi:hypothetical protein A2U01_0097785, partial [Trifolium medium]|nr:hypothetical protein [Trifolium medium]